MRYSHSRLGIVITLRGGAINKPVFKLYKIFCVLLQISHVINQLNTKWASSDFKCRTHSRSARIQRCTAGIFALDTPSEPGQQSPRLKSETRPTCHGFESLKIARAISLDTVWTSNPKRTLLACLLRRYPNTFAITSVFRCSTIPFTQPLVFLITSPLTTCRLSGLSIPPLTLVNLITSHPFPGAR